MFKVLVIIFLVNVTLAGFYPLLPIHVKNLTSDNAAIWSGLIIGVPFFLSAVMGPIWGRVAQIRGFKLVFMIQALAISVSFVLQAYSDTALSLFLSRSIGNIFAGLISSLFAYISLIAKEGDLGKSLTSASIASALGFVAGPGLVGLVVSQTDFKTAFNVAALITFIIFILLAFLKFDSLKKNEEVTEFRFLQKFLGDVHKKSVQKSYLLVFILFTLISITTPLEVEVIQRILNEEDVALKLGQILTIGSLLGLFVSIFVGKGIDKGYTKAIFIICLIGSCLSTFFIGMTSSFMIFAIALIIKIISQCEYNSLSNVMVINNTMDSLRGQAVIATFSIVKIGVFFGSSISGFFSQSIGTQNTILFSSVCLLLFIFVIVKDFKNQALSQ